MKWGVRKDSPYWSEWTDLNRRPSAPKADALPGCATLHQNSRTVSSSGRNRISQCHPLQRCGHISGTYLKGQTVLATLLSSRRMQYHPSRTQFSYPFTLISVISTNTNCLNIYWWKSIHSTHCFDNIFPINKTINHIVITTIHLSVHIIEPFRWIEQLYDNQRPHITPLVALPQWKSTLPPYFE